jgi:hypothetical protein
MASTIPRGSREDPLVGPAATGTTSPGPGRAPLLPRPRSPEPQHAPPPAAPVLPPQQAPAPGHTDATATEAAPSFVELLEDVLAGGSLMGRQRPGIRERCRRFVFPVGTSGEPLILLCGWLFALSIALAAFVDLGPFSGPDDAVLMLLSEGVLTVAVFAALALAKALRRARVAKPVEKVPADGSAAQGDRPRTSA